MNTFTAGQQVTFTGWCKEQVRWGNNDTPSMLVEGESYTIASVEEHRSHTKVILTGLPSLKFNSVHFTAAQ